MRILLVTMGMDIGGAETHILELAKELKNRGHNVFVVSNGGKYVTELENYGIEHIWAPLNNKKIKNMIKSYKILKNVITEKNIEIVHSHSRITSFICGILKKKMKFYFVTSAHYTFKVTRLLKFLTNWGENVIAVSDDIKDYLIKNYNIKPENIFLTVNGIDTNKFSKETDYKDILKEFDLKDDANRIVYISRLDESCAKAGRVLLDIAENLNNQINNLEILIVGGGNVYNELKEKADAINKKINKKLIILTGPRTDINKFAACGTIFIGVSRALLEAMACEEPVIVAGAQGYLGIFDDSKLSKAIDTNFCCRGLNMTTKEQMEKDVLELINKSSEEKANYGKYNRKIVEEYYSIKKMVDDTLLAYDKTVNKK